MQFYVGDKAVYPAHGLGVVKRVETRSIGGALRDFYVLQITSSGATLMIPTEDCERTGMRPVVSPEQIAEVYAILRSPSKPQHTTWNRRFREFNDKLRTGSLLDTAEVLRDLLAVKGDKDLSYGEKKMMDKALAMIITEVAEATGRQPEEVETELLGVLPR